MKAYVVNHYGKNTRLLATQLPIPTVARNEVLIEVHATALNPLDSKIKSGEFKALIPYKPPFILGHDVAGIITQAGADVKQFKVGDAVYARPADHHIGTFAEFISINEQDVALKPTSLSMVEAASIPLVGLTAWQVLVERFNLEKGQKVFIQGGSGGLGTFAIQLTKHLGGFVATTTSTANVGLVKQLGADVVVDYKTQDFASVLEDYDFVLNSQDAHTLKKSLSVLKPHGTVVSVSGPPDVAFAEKAGLPWLFKQVMRLLSFSIRHQAKKRQVNYAFHFMTASGKQLSEITPLLEAGVIKPVIDKVFAFDALNDAMDYMETGRSKGKIVIKVR